MKDGTATGRVAAGRGEHRVDGIGGDDRVSAAWILAVPSRVVSVRCYGKRLPRPARGRWIKG